MRKVAIELVDGTFKESSKYAAHTAEEKEIVKEIKEMAEESKVQVRNARREAIDKIKALKKSGDITEDDQKNGEKKVQDLTDKFTKEIDAISDKKQKEIMAI